MSLWTQNNGSNCERWILANKLKKNKLCLISIQGVFYQDTKLIHVTFYQCFDRLLSPWIINEFLTLSNMYYLLQLTYNSILNKHFQNQSTEGVSDCSHKKPNWIKN